MEMFTAERGKPKKSKRRGNAGADAENETGAGTEKPPPAPIRAYSRRFSGQKRERKPMFSECAVSASVVMSKRYPA